MSAKVSRQPNRVAQVGRKILAYLNTTKSLKLVLGPEHSRDGGADEGQPGRISVDASFSPYGEKSYGVSVVTVLQLGSLEGFQTRVRHPFGDGSRTLRSLNAVIVMESVGSILDEVLGHSAHRVLRVDNSSVVAMLEGGPGSWRARHLEVRSATLRDQELETYMWNTSPGTYKSLTWPPRCIRKCGYGSSLRCGASRIYLLKQWKPWKPRVPGNVGFDIDGLCHQC